ncbi:hypothetical protein TNCV_4095701 [Trichonephila clavipes]|uniref:Uncharacterized protein n=1 Tax=Trichonephila clavipes TaxID=2585209 RepID=A0A8X6VIY3_TRICX|nr:hypothetical protein TNCV_4095701 [Trichonephila clavipes]
MPGRFQEQSMPGSALSHWLTNPLNSEVSERSSHSWRCTPSLSIFSFKLQNLLSPLLPPPSSEDLRWFRLSFFSQLFRYRLTRFASKLKISLEVIARKSLLQISYSMRSLWRSS